ncbi:4-coumarate--coa ligase-like 4 [Plakobranchus ocellatus]|uniref:Medium-chain acyl-CoA ligase ACSF2, mitochondrial n=1 Tax=Plakobranchus ocellatus TaxID=259542 RepID=A0AAV4A4T2_9GAST|nr:4-coumarate--coa ligase-like 4 [Plakobranchus ocellatus]
MPVTRSHLEELRPLARRFSIIYGSHELGIVSMNLFTADEINDFQDYDNGALAPGVQMRLVDSSGRDVKPGQRGRILIKSPCMFHGYPKEPDRTAARFNKDGWFMSYDQARIDPKTQHVFSGGRIDAIILHGQYMLFPCWLDAMVSPHPAVKQVVSVPFPDAVLFHAIGICIIRHPGTSLSSQEVVQMIESNVVPGKEFLIRPKAVLFFESFPTKPDGTVDKPRLSDIVAEQVKNGMA